MRRSEASCPSDGPFVGQHPLSEQEIALVQQWTDEGAPEGDPGDLPRPRDVAEIRQRDFPVYARGVTHRGPYKDGPGEINVPVSVGGMVVNPGDIVVGDQDGLLAIPQEGVEQLIEKAQAVLEAEAETMRAMKEGRWNRAFVDELEARCNN